MSSLPLKNACAFSVSPLINLVGVGLERRGHQCLPLILPNFFTKKSASYHTFKSYSTIYTYKTYSIWNKRYISVKQEK